jgi:hypothetical protein
VSGLATASLVDPEREAVRWFENQRPSLKGLGGGEPVVVLGVGSGFHLEVLANHYPRHQVIALDVCESSIAFVQAKFEKKKTENLSLYLVDLAQGMSTFFLKQAWVSQAFTLLRHRSSCARNGEAMRLVDAWLVGRVPTTFSNHLRVRPELAACFESDRALEVISSMCGKNEEMLFSVREISKLWDVKSNTKEARRLFRVIEELVK